ncbi:hypothetical protein ACHWQZ_G009127 [Mnemiopsis leidyi]
MFCSRQLLLLNLLLTTLVAAESPKKCQKTVKAFPGTPEKVHSKPMRSQKTQVCKMFAKSCCSEDTEKLMRNIVSTGFKDLLLAELNMKINLIERELEGDLIPTLFSDEINKLIRDPGNVTYRDLARIAAQTLVRGSCSELPLTAQLVEKLETKLAAPADRLKVLYSSLLSIQQVLEAATRHSLPEECVVAVMKNGLYSGLEFSMKMCQVCSRETARLKPCFNTCRNVSRDCLDKFRGVSSLINELASQLDRHRAQLTSDVERIFEVVEEWRADRENLGYFQDCVIDRGELIFDLKEGASLVFSSNPLQLHDIFRRSADYACWRSEDVGGDCWTEEGVTVVDSVELLPYTTPSRTGTNVSVTMPGKESEVMIAAIESLQNAIEISEKVNRGEPLVEPESLPTTFVYTTDTGTVEQRSTSGQKSGTAVSTGDRKTLTTLTTLTTSGVAEQVDNLEMRPEVNTMNTTNVEQAHTSIEQAHSTVEQAHATVEQAHSTVEQAHTTVEQAHTTVEQAHSTVEQAHTTVEQAHTTVEQAHTTVEQAHSTVEQAHATVEQAHSTVEQEPTPVKQTSVEQAVSRELTSPAVEELPKSTEQADQGAITFDKSAEDTVTINHVTKRQVTLEIAKEQATNRSGQEVLSVQDVTEELGTETDPTGGPDKDRKQDRITPVIENVTLNETGHVTQTNNSSKDKASQENPVVNDTYIETYNEESRTVPEHSIGNTNKNAYNRSTLPPDQGSAKNSEPTEKFGGKSDSNKQSDEPITKPVHSNTEDMRPDMRSTTERKPREVDKPASEFRDHKESHKTDQKDRDTSEKESDDPFPEFVTPTNDQHATTPKPTSAWDLVNNFVDEIKQPPDSSSLAVDGKHMISLVALCLGIIYILRG